MTSLITCQLLFITVLVDMVAGQSISSLPDDEAFEGLPLEELEKATRMQTTLAEQCERFKNHHRYYCKTSNIAEYNEEVRIICERYDIYCAERAPATIDYIRRMKAYWRESGLPVSAQRAISTCLRTCRENDPVCVQACDCIHYHWIMRDQCQPGARWQALPNCQRWAAKCKQIWRPRVDLTPLPRGVLSPWPIVRGTYYGYDGPGNYETFLTARKHGVGFYRQTQTTFVNWPEGKLGTGFQWQAPIIGIGGLIGTDIGFPSLAEYLNKANAGNPDRLNPGTGRSRFFKVTSLH